MKILFYSKVLTASKGENGLLSLYFPAFISLENGTYIMCKGFLKKPLLSRNLFSKTHDYLLQATVSKKLPIQSSVLPMQYS